MGLFQRIRDDRRRQKAVQVKQEIANHLTLNPLCSDYENVFAQVQPLINDMKMVRPFGVGKNGGRLPMARTPELALLDSPNDEMGWGEFASAMFATWLTEDELDIHVHMDRNKVIGYSLLPVGCKVYTGTGDYYFQVNNNGVYENIGRENVMILRFSRSPRNLQRGVSPATAVRAWAQAEDVLAQYERAYIENGAIPASITFIRASSYDKFNQTRRELEGNLKGASNHGKTVYVWRQFNNDTGESLDQVEVKTIQGNNSTLAIKELTDIINDHLNKAFGVSNFILGDDSSAKYDNAELSDYQFIKRRVYPALMAFWDQFQFELDRVVGGLGYGIQFELELPDLTDRLKTKAEIAEIRTRTLTSMIQNGANPTDAVKALGLGEEWQKVARGMWTSVLVGGMALEQKHTTKNGEAKSISHLNKPSLPSTGQQHITRSHKTCPCDHHSTSTTDELPEMDDDERKIYNALVAMAERIFANTPNIQADEVVNELVEVLERKAELGATEGAEKIIDMISDKDVQAEITSSLEKLELSGTLKDRIQTRTTDIVNNYGENARKVMEEVLNNSVGLSASEISRELRAAIPNFTWQAERIARTETVYAYKSGRLDEDERVNKTYGLDMKLVWRARHDLKTCNVCAAMDGQVVDIGDAYRDELVVPAGTHMINMKPGETLDDDLQISWVPSHWNDDGRIPSPHPNCRCYFDEVVS